MASDVYGSLGDVALELSAAKIDAQNRIPDLSPTDRGPLERSEIEERVGSLLESINVEEAWETAPALVAEGWDTDLLGESISGLDPADARTLARWLGLRSLAGQLLNELRIAANRVSELVRVVKGYSFLDQAPVQEVDVTEGIGDTLILLKPKLANIEVTTEYEEGLARIEAPGRDLNQIWTNLIDNAADAMEGEGALAISARNSDGHIEVRVQDTGPGMDPQTAERIFDPFFTTKEPGKGTGLGLHTVHTIVGKCGGEISVETGPEGTTFILRFPAITEE